MSLPLRLPGAPGRLQRAARARHVSAVSSCTWTDQASPPAPKTARRRRLRGAVAPAPPTLATPLPCPGRLLEPGVGPCGWKGAGAQGQEPHRTACGAGDTASLEVRGCGQHRSSGPAVQRLQETSGICGEIALDDGEEGWGAEWQSPGAQGSPHPRGSYRSRAVPPLSCLALAPVRGP